MPCPSCGGEIRKLIAPGFWECESMLTSTEMRAQLTPEGPRHLPVDSHRVCGVRYHESDARAAAGSLPVCGCGTFAVGVCADCQTPVCGDHSTLFEGRRLCDEHVVVAREAAAQARAAARVTVAVFIQASREAGHPGVREWEVIRADRTRYTLTGWTIRVDEGSRWWTYLLSADGAVFGRPNESKWFNHRWNHKSWETDPEVLEENLMTGVTLDRATAESVDVALRRLAQEHQIPL